MKLKEKIKEIFCNKKIFYSIDAGLFLSGIILMLFSKLYDTESELRVIIAGVFIAFSYFLFPFINMNKKEKIALTLAIHIILFSGCFYALFFSLDFYVNSNVGNTLYEIPAALGILFAISYSSYLFIEFFRNSYCIILKIKAHLLTSSAKENYSATKKIIEGITAFLVAVTAMTAGISALIASINALINLFRR